ncbi:phytanoyl-CoA dioxygenase family protein [Thioalkalivibrio sp. HK1]|uniref:phytanoyl-CoA dioxygenase family protein n=1 Tax=Thioalkalivibrio sp. HK1 TaxID=1469245 RepID=UPI000471648B|nr:phytanoyl-CoA dioxygenase family protein [Thioalkalivibrio sp. HK1]
MNERTLNDPTSLDHFARDGYLVAQGLAGKDITEPMTQAICHALSPLQAPAEFEAEVGYPGSPESRGATGGGTPRRLLHAFSRGSVFRRWARSPEVATILRCIMGSPKIEMSQCHHNCIMTKHPGFSSETAWHQDIRYWSFDTPELVSVWLALGPEREDNGALRVIPGSHRLHPDRGRLDKNLFLRPELDENREMIERSQLVELRTGDVLFFHCRLFHAAGRNRSDKTKISAVFTYHTDDNRPIPGTRSDRYPGIPL